MHEVYSPAAPYSRVKLDYPVNLGGYEHPKNPDQPMCLHMVYVPTLPGSGLSAREQSRKGRAMILGMPFEQHEQMIREQLQGMLGGAGFNHEQDILAITVNRWSHGYSYITNTLFDDEEQCDKWIELGRQPVGNITIANSDSDWSPTPTPPSIRPGAPSTSWLPCTREVPNDPFPDPDSQRRAAGPARFHPAGCACHVGWRIRGQAGDCAACHTSGRASHWPAARASPPRSAPSMPPTSPRQDPRHWQLQPARVHQGDARRITRSGDPSTRPCPTPPTPR